MVEGRQNGSDTALSAANARKEVDKEPFQIPENCEWMFGDAATGWLGVNALARLNPLRWSGPIPLEQAIQDLTDLQQHEDRAISVKIPANTLSQTEFPNIREAIAFIRQAMNAVDKEPTSKSDEPRARPEETPEEQKEPQPLQAAPLIRFEKTTGHPILQNEGIELLRRLPSPVQVVMFLGRGRCGKSTTLNQLARQPHDNDLIQRFRVGNSMEPVTYGADVVALPTESGGHILYIDCEGSNNALAKTNAHCHVLALLSFLVATQIVQCDLGAMPEQALEELATMAAARDMIMTSNAAQYTPDLCFLALQCGLQVPEDLINMMLNVSQTEPTQIEPARVQVRNAIVTAFGNKIFRKIPHHSEKEYASAINELRGDLAKAPHVQSGGVDLSGAELANVLEGLCKKVKECSRSSSFKAAVEPDSIYACVVRSRLEDIASKCLQEFEDNLPSFHNFDEKTVNELKEQILLKFDAETGAIDGRRKKRERDTLGEEMDALCRLRKQVKLAVDMCAESYRNGLPPPELEHVNLSDLKERVNTYLDDFVAQIGNVDDEMLTEVRAELGKKMCNADDERQERQSEHRRSQPNRSGGLSWRPFFLVAVIVALVSLDIVRLDQENLSVRVDRHKLRAPWDEHRIRFEELLGYREPTTTTTSPIVAEAVPKESPTQPQKPVVPTPPQEPVAPTPPQKPAVNSREDVPSQPEEDQRSWFAHVEDWISQSDDFLRGWMSGAQSQWKRGLSSGGIRIPTGARSRFGALSWSREVGPWMGAFFAIGSVVGVSFLCCPIGS